MIKLAFAVTALIAAALAAGAYFGFNPVIPIFIILGFGVYGVGRIGGPSLPDDAPVVWGPGHGIYMRGKDYAPDYDADGGQDQREGDGFR